MAKIRLGRWFYCKYCYRSIRPEIGDGVVMCPICNYGLAPLDAVEKAGSLEAWYRDLVAKFNAKYGSKE